MTPRELSFDLGLDEADDEAALRARVAKELRRPASELPPLRLLRRSIDARRGRVVLHVVVGLGGEPEGPLGLPHPAFVKPPARVVIVGDGPCGIFCAYELARRGIASVVLDRGKPVQPRRRDLRGLNRDGVVDADSNYCFGEGGAGTYSDGKLYTRATKRGDVRDVLEVLALHDAPPDILVEARPHIGSNRLPHVVSAIRARLEAAGVAFRFGVRVVDVAVSGGRAHGVVLADGSALEADAVVVATGHSARDVLAFLARAGAALEPKAFALGVRVEHPQPLIDSIQYGKACGHPKLPAASYRLAHTEDERGVFSFCMCPGGFVVPASTEPGELVVNGMSLKRRDSPYANSGLVVGIEVEDAPARGWRTLVDVQARIERAAWEAGGGKLRAPATRVTDFLAGRPSSTVPATSYQPGLLAGDVGAVLDAAGIPLARQLRTALSAFGRQMPGFLTEEAVLIGVESRTSSPVRVVRDSETLETPGLRGLYPGGEGAGYAGGIMSAALDGIRIARAIAAARSR